MDRDKEALHESVDSVDNAEKVQNSNVFPVEVPASLGTPKRAVIEIDDQDRLFDIQKNEKERKGIFSCLILIVGTIIPHGGTLANVCSLASATLGAGIITLPWAFHASGILMGTMYLAIMTVFTVYTISIMGIVMEKTGFRAFEQMSRGVLGRGADYFMALVMGVSCFGAAVAYVIAASSLITPLVRGFQSAPDFLKSDGGIRILTTIVWLGGMLPLVIPKKINTLRYFSAFGVCFIIYFTVAVAIRSCHHGLPKRSEVKLVETGNVAMEGLGVFVFSYLCHAVAYQVYFEMKIRSVKKLVISTLLSMSACTCFYWVFGFFGYMEFGVNIQESILYMFDPINDPVMMVAYLGLVVKICVSYAMNMIPCRNTVYYVLGWDLESLPYWKHATVVMFASVIVLLCGLFIPRISTAFGLAGAVCGGFIGFIYPSLFYMYSGGWTLEKVGWFHYIMTYLSLVAGVFSVVFGTGATIFSTVSGS